MAADFRELNKLINRKVYNLTENPRHSYSSQRIRLFFRKSMCLCTFTPSNSMTSQKTSALSALLFSCNYRYNRLPMGVLQSPDVAQEIMEDIFCDLDETDVYIDDVGAFNDG
jgi:hypothetical protein